MKTHSKCIVQLPQACKVYSSYEHLACNYYLHNKLILSHPQYLPLNPLLPPSGSAPPIQLSHPKTIQGSWQPTWSSLSYFTFQEDQTLALLLTLIFNDLYFHCFHLKFFFPRTYKFILQATIKLSSFLLLKKKKITNYLSLYFLFNFELKLQLV